MNSELFLHTIAARLTRFKGKAFLMGLGIIVSVLTTVIMQSLGGTVRTTFNGFVGQLYPDDTVTLNAGAALMGRGRGAENMRLKDVEAVAASVPAIIAWDPLAFAGRRDVRANERTGRTSVVGVSERSPQVRRRSVSSGEFLSAADVTGRSRVALIGPTAAKALFAAEEPIGATVFIDNTPFKVKGVLESLGMSPHGDDQDDVIIVPYTVVMDSLAKVDYLRTAMFKVAAADDVEGVVQQIAGVMRERHAIGAGQSDDFTVTTPREIREMVARTFGTLNLFVVLICAAAFVVSALVLLGVMLVSIRQRTAELGLRKAVGADAGQIRTQIVCEVVVVAAAGCVVGTMLAYPALAVIGPMLAAKFGIARASMSFIAVGIATTAALVTGLVGALWPAMRAARLNPVDALSVR